MAYTLKDRDPENEFPELPPPPQMYDIIQYNRILLWEPGVGEWGTPVFKSKAN